MDELKKIELAGRIIEKSLEEEEEIVSEGVTSDSEEELVEEEQKYLSKEEAIELIKEEAAKQFQEMVKQLKEDAAGKTEFAAKPEFSREHEPSFDEKDSVVLTSKQIVDKGNYMNIKRLAVLIAQAADMIIGEFSDAQNVIAPDVNRMVKKYFTFLADFIRRLPDD